MGRLGAVPKPTAVILLAAVIVASWGLTSQWLDGSDPTPRPTPSAADYRISFWQARAEADDLDYLSRTYLGAAYLDAGRRSGDLAAYDAAAASLGQALELNPRYSPALATLAAVHLGRHEFPTALAVAEQAYDHDPASVEALAAMADAHLELGHYDQAADGYETLHRRLPGAAAEARLARLAFLFGQPDEAIERASRALQLAGTAPDPSYGVALATYALDSGHIELASDAAEAALGGAPDSRGALETLAQVRAAQGQLEEAAAIYERLLRMGPDPGAHRSLGDLYSHLDRPDDAQEQYLAVEPAAQAITNSPVVFDREIALFLADHQLDIDRAVELAERDLNNRQDIYAYDTLAWARYHADDLHGATQASEKALALGTKDPHLLYHAGMIAAATGNTNQARQLLNQALAINPNFDVLQAPLATDALRQLNSQP